jgi:predicted aconitase
MRQLFGRTGVLTVVAWAAGSVAAFANAPAEGGPPDYSGITALYSVLIGAILVYGVYDTFFKKS